MATVVQIINIRNARRKRARAGAVLLPEIKRTNSEREAFRQAFQKEIRAAKGE